MLERGATKMSGQCRYFEQHAWKREICTNCFKPREEHLGNAETSRPSVVKASVNLNTDVQKLQSILRGRPTSQSSRRKNVAFPVTLTEVIGYGGNDFSDGEENGESEDSDNFELSDPGNTEDDAPDSEEDRALGNLTRANTNFNTITANLTETGNSESKAAKSFASLMLGKVQKDSEGKKKTLLVSVTPFGGDDALPTAKRPSDRKSANNSTNPCKSKNDEIPSSSIKQESERTETTMKNPGKTTASNNKTVTIDGKVDNDTVGLEKIVDMPLITSSNLISVIQKSDTLTTNMDYQNQITKTEKRSTAISRCPAIKKPENEKPKVIMQSANYSTKSDYTVSKVTKVTGLETRLGMVDSPTFDSGVDLDEISSRSSDKTETTVGSESKNGIDVTTIDESSKITGDIEERTVEGQAGPEPILLSNRRFSFEESREHAGEPDGKADEEEITEPPALPRSPPPIDSRNCRANNCPIVGAEPRSSIMGAEPRPSFLHGETKFKPLVPQKPMSLPSKPASPLSNSVGGPNTFKGHSGGHVPPRPSVKNASGSGPNSGRLVVNDKTTINDSDNRISPNNRFSKITSSDHGAGKTLQNYQDHMADQSSGKVSDAVAEVATSNFKPNGSSNVLGSDFQGCRTGGPSIVSKDKPESSNSKGINGEDSEEASQSMDEDTSGDVNAELIRSSNKRRMAPKPPAAPAEEYSASIFARNPATANVKSDCPVVREKEKRERASSCSPKFRKAVCEAPDPCTQINPEPAPRRTISLSQGSLATADKSEEKKKRPRFSLKRLLRMGSRKDVDMTTAGCCGSRLDDIPTSPQPKPRLEIIHPLELDGAAVEVLRHDRIVTSGHDVTDSKLDNSTQSSESHQHALATRPGKPPPPPRNNPTQDDWIKTPDATNKPVRPPPPRKDEKTGHRSDKPIFSKTWQPAANPSASDSIYSNLAAEGVAGEMRSEITSGKATRTASIRDQTIVQPPIKKRNVPCEIDDREYEKQDLVRPPTSDSPTSNDSHAYECLSSSPECDSNLELRHAVGGSNRSNCKRKSDSGASDTCAGDFKYHQPTFARSTSLPYCGSETESELYAPYSFYTGDEGPEDDQDWKAKEEEFGMNRVRQRRGRSIVHRSLEDNYGAVIVANHEALAQLLERLNQPSSVPAYLRSLKTSNPRMKDFDVDFDSFLAMEKKVFCSASWNDHAVTVCLTLEAAVASSRKEFSLTPIVEFVDVVPENISMKCFAGRKYVDAIVSIFARMRVHTLQSFSTEFSRNDKTDDWIRDSSFVFLQLVDRLKNLQTRGIDKVSRNLCNVVLCREDKDPCYRLHLLRDLNVVTDDDRDDERVSLCQCALVALRELRLDGKLPVVRESLMRERDDTLSQVKSVLEFTLWGPSDAMLGVVKERETVLQRWLDLERANVLHALVRTRAPLTVADEYQLMFLVRTTARTMCEASVSLDEQQPAR